MLAAGGNVAAVFADDASKSVSFLGFPVFDGDCHDHRYSDPRNVVVALRAKGTAKKDQSGFVVR